MATETVTITRRSWWSHLPSITVEIECATDALPGVKIGLALKVAFGTGAVLTDAVLRDADLRGAVLTDAVLTGAVLRDADLRGAVLTGADLTGADLTGAVLRDADLRGADLTGAVLTDADLTGADLTGAVLTGAVLTDAVLTGADLRGADLRGVPKIENIHQAVYAAASAPGALDMGDWHRCETTHCRAGWVTTLAGEEGKALEDRIGTPSAATLIYLASDPTLDRIPSFYCENTEAMADMKRLAEAEAARAA